MRLLQHSGGVATTDALAPLPPHRPMGTVAAAALPLSVTPGVGRATAVRRARVTPHPLTAAAAGVSSRARSLRWPSTPMPRRRCWPCGRAPEPPLLLSRRRRPLLLLPPHDTVCLVRRRRRAPASRGALLPPLREARRQSKGGQGEWVGVVGSPFPSPLPAPAQQLQRLPSDRPAVPSRPPLVQAAAAGAPLSSPLRVRVRGRTQAASRPSRASSSRC